MTQIIHFDYLVLGGKGDIEPRSNSVVYRSFQLRCLNLSGAGLHDGAARLSLAGEKGDEERYLVSVRERCFRKMNETPQFC